MVFKLTVQNASPTPKMVKVSMLENADAEQPVNLHWPRSGFRTKLDANSFKTLGFLTKIHPTETFGQEAGLTEAGKLDFSLKCKDDLEKIASNPQATEVQGPVPHGGPTEPEQTSGTHEMGTGPDAGIEGYNPNDFGGAGEDRQCPVCTFANPISNKQCEMCTSNMD